MENPQKETWNCRHHVSQIIELSLFAIRACFRPPKTTSRCRYGSSLFISMNFQNSFISFLLLLLLVVVPIHPKARFTKTHKHHTHTHTQTHTHTWWLGKCKSTLNNYTFKFSTTRNLLLVIKHNRKAKSKKLMSEKPAHESTLRFL